MAAVYRVRDAKSDARYALKRVWADDKKRLAKRKALLEREFHTLTHLRHPRIIEVYDFGVDADGPYYTMELLDGSDLDAGGRLPWQEACALLRDIASSLAIIHSRGLIHRDVSARNVRKTADGRAKLIDFGGMVSMGAANDVIGTPPFMSPEVLQMQSLDARADLFSLGALGFYLLTGRHAFPSRRTQDLRDAWRTKPPAPSRQFPEIPMALSALVLQLLSLDRGGRPQTAAEVMERLCVIGDLPKEELPEIVSAYLATPTLVGRQRTLLAIRGRMLSLVRGDGGALLIEGPAGSGRSRMIDACVFEGKLLSTVVTRAGASDATQPWGVAKAIASQLFSLLPAEAYEATRLSIAHLGHLIDELRPDSADSVPITPPERSLVLRELRDFALTLARNKQRLLIAIDDADHIDEPSMAWLAALADKADRQSLLIALAMEPERPGEPPPATVLRSLAHRETLQPLAAEQTEALLRSVFGEAKNLGLIAGHIHGLSLGSPRATIELAQHLVDRGLARYDSGSWLLPQELDTSDLPATLSESLARRLDALSPDARELAEALSIGDAQAFPAAAYKALTEHRDQDRVYRAIEDLVSARVLTANSENYSFSQSGFVSVLSSRMLPERKATLHGRLADLLANSGAGVVPRAEHLMAAGRELEAVTLLCSADLQVRLPPLPLLEAAVTFAEREPSLPARATHRLRMALLSKAALLLEANAFERWLPPVVAQLKRDSGLQLYEELSHLPEKERLSAALTQTQQRYLALPEDEKVYVLVDAVRELARLTGAASSIAGSAFDVTILDKLPALEPLLPLSPALRIITQAKTATRDWLSGRAERACRLYEDILSRVAQPDRAGMDDAQAERAQVAVRYVLALHEGVNGIDHAEEHAQFLEGRRQLRVNAWRVRSLLQLSQGDAEAAAKSARRAELLQLQDDETHYPGTGVGLQMSASFLAADLLGVKRMLDSLEQLAQSHRGWQPLFLYGQSCYRYLSGDLEEALERVLAGFEFAVPGQNLPWGFLAAQHIKLLRELGRKDESLARAQQYMEIAHTEELTMAQRFILMESALAFAVAGQADRALGIIEPLIQHIESIGAHGLALGVFYEARARIAIALLDRAGFERAAESCAREFSRSQNAAVSAKFARLMDEARQQDLAPAEAAPFEVALRLEPESPELDQNNTIVSRILECVDASDRARCALTMLLQSSESYLGHLYGVQGDRLIALAGLPSIEAEPDLEQWLWRWLSAERETAALTATTNVEGDDYETVDTAGVSDEDYDTVDTSGEEDYDTVDSSAHDMGTPTAQGGKPAHSVSAEYVDAEGKRYHAVMAIQEHKGVRRIAAVLALHVESGFRRRPPQRLLAQVAKQLLAHGDVRGAVLGEPPNLNAL